MQKKWAENVTGQESSQGYSPFNKLTGYKQNNILIGLPPIKISNYSNVTQFQTIYLQCGGFKTIDGT